MQPTTAPVLDDGAQAARTDTTRGRPVITRAAAALVLLAFGLALTAGALTLAAPSASVTGEVVAFGGGGGECYPTVAYEVDGTGYRFTPSEAARWCVLEHGGPAKVYYDPDDPEDARLSRYGELPRHLTRGALVALVVAGFVATTRRSGTRSTRIVAWVLLGAWGATAVATVLTAERTASFADLREAVARGDVDEVGVNGELGRGHGRATVEVYWRDNGLNHVAEVVQRRDRRGLRTGPTKGDLTAALTAEGGTVELEQHAPPSGGLHATVAGWTIDGDLVWPFLAAFAMTIRVLTAAAEPWRATRWAWFWLIFALPPAGGPAYLLLGGPTGVARPRSPGARLTGIWAFLLAAVVSALVAA